MADDILVFILKKSFSILNGLLLNILLLSHNVPVSIHCGILNDHRAKLTVAKVIQKDCPGCREQYERETLLSFGFPLFARLMYQPYLVFREKKPSTHRTQIYVHPPSRRLLYARTKGGGITPRIASIGGKKSIEFIMSPSCSHRPGDRKQLLLTADGKAY